MSVKKENKWLTPPMMFSYVMAVVAAFASYQNFQNDTGLTVARQGDKIDGLARRIKVIEDKLSRRTDFMMDASKRIDFVCEHQPACINRYAPLEVPVR